MADKYRDISDFKKRVLEPARREIAEAADRGDCTFDYEFRYPAGKKRGTPEAIVFHIHITDLGRGIKQRLLETREAIELRKKGMTPAHSITAASPSAVTSAAESQQSAASMELWDQD